MADRRHVPAVPLKLMNRSLRLRATCSMAKCPSRKIACERVSRLSQRLRCSQRVWTAQTLGSVK